MLETFTVATFQPHLDEGFRLHAQGAPPVDLILVAATELPAPSAGRRRVPFSIEFLGPTSPILPQATYGVEHAELGAFDLFLVPIAAGAEGVRYEAVFT